jgi:hypothetical protein|tara:strand:+ start:11882 stop:12628 length:747 start_codon:yes stop_codon:yes gene_type:complete
MKKIIPFLIVFMFMLSIVVSAGPSPPYVFQVEVTSGGVALDDIIVKINNMDYKPDIEDSFITEKTGRAIFSLSEEGRPYTVLSYEYNARGDYGDRIGVRICQEGTGDHCYTSYEIGKECPVDVSCLVKIDLEKGAIVIDKDGVERDADDFKTKYQCWNGAMVWNEADCTEEPKDDDDPEEGGSAWWYSIYGALIVLVATVLESKYKWGKSFIGLVKYWAIKRKDPKRAMKMLKTAMKKDEAEHYKKKK